MTHPDSPRAARGHRETILELAAEAIYDAMRDHDPEGKHRPWIEHGNSLKQDEARRRARAALRAALASVCEDAERLNWLESKGEVFGEWVDYECVHDFEWRIAIDRIPLRAAIDAARSPSPEPAMPTTSAEGRTP